MLDLDLILLRMMLTSLLVSLLLSCFLLLRLIMPQWCSGRMRRLTWLLLFVLSLFVFPWPTRQIVPVETPDWVYSWRLPDPAIPDLGYLISEPQIVAATGEDGQQSNISHIDESEVPQNNFLHGLLDILPIWRGIYLIGFILVSVISLFIGCDRCYRRYIMIKIANRIGNQTKATAVSLDREAWQEEIAILRDQTRIYRHADVVLSDTDPNELLTLLINWKKHRIAVPSGHPGLITPKKRRNLLMLAIDRNIHPDCGILFILFLLRSLLWFNPLWWLIRPILNDDLQMARYERMEKRIKQVSSADAKTISISKLWHVTAGLVYAIAFIACLIIIYWQLPRILLPDIKSKMQNGENEDYGLMVKKASSGVNSNCFADQILVDQRHLIVKEGEAFSIQAIDQQGQLIWQSNVTDLIPEQLDIKEILYFAISGSCHLDDGRWALSANIMTEKGDKILYIQLTADGKLIRLQVLNQSLNKITNLINGQYYENMNIVLFDDGGWLASALISNAEDSGNYHYQLYRFSEEGQVIWQKVADDIQWKNLQLGIFEQSGYHHVRTINQMMTTNDSGFYLLISEIVYSRQSNPDEQPFLQKISDQVIRFSADGQLLWSRRISGQERIFKTLTASVAEDNQLYLAGFETWRTPSLLLPSIYSEPDQPGDYQELYSQARIVSVQPDGTIAWGKSFYGLAGSFCQDLLVQPNLLTILFTQNHPPNQTTNEITTTRTIIQMDFEGKQLGQLTLNEISPSNNYALMIVQAGQIMIPDQ